MVRELAVDWQVVLLFVPIGLELIRQTVGTRFGEHRLFYFDAPYAMAHRRRLCRDRADGVDPDQDLEHRPHRASAAGTGEPAARGEDRGAQEPDQPALPVQHADLGLLADPIAAGDGAHGDSQAVGAAATSSCAVRNSSSRCAKSSIRSTSTSTSRSSASGPRLALRKDIRRRYARHPRAQHDSPAAGRERDQARTDPQGRRRPHHAAQPPRRRTALSSTSKTMASASRTSGCRRRCRAASGSATSMNGCA